MTSVTIPAIKAAQARLANAVLESLRSSHAPHYRTADVDVLRDRAEVLAERLVCSVTDESAALVNHVRRIAEERMDEGYALEEVQLALNVLEGEAWAVTVEAAGAGAGAPELVAQLSLLTSVVGAAKDQLARVYYARKQMAEMRVVELERMVEQIMRGTTGAADVD